MDQETERIVATQKGDVKVNKLKVVDYAKILKALKKLPKQFGEWIEDTPEDDLKDMQIAEFLPVLPELIGDALPEFCDVLAAATDKEGEFFATGDLADMVDVFVAAYEINDFSRIVKSVKKLLALTSKKQVQAGDDQKK